MPRRSTPEAPAATEVPATTPVEAATEVQRKQSAPIETSAKPDKPKGWSDDDYHRLYHIPPADFTPPPFPSKQ
jgi:hypothetical protein